MKQRTLEAARLVAGGTGIFSIVFLLGISCGASCDRDSTELIGRSYREEANAQCQRVLRDMNEELDRCSAHVYRDHAAFLKENE